MGNAQRKNDDDVSFAPESSANTSVSSISSASSASKVRETKEFIPPVLPDKIAREAVNNHLRYLKARGTTHISVHEVARALNLSAEQVKRVAVMVGATLED